MKSLYSFLFFLISLTSSAQKATVIFYDSDWKITNKEESTYFRACTIDTANLSFDGEVKDYYKTSKLEMWGTYKDNIKVDSFFFYYPNGNIESKGLYINNLRSGVWKYFYENGQVKQVVEFHSYDFNIKAYYDSLGNATLIRGTGLWKNAYRLHNQFAWVRVEGNYENWKRDGKWKAFRRFGDSEEKLEYTDKFRDGILKSAWYAGSFLSAYFPDKYKLRMTEEFNYSGFASKKIYPHIKKLPNDIDSLELPYDTDATFPGGDKELHKFVKKNLRYPELAKNNGIGQDVTVAFTIDKNGKITNIIAEVYERDREKNKYGFHEELIRVIRLFPRWSPATRNKENVPQKQSLTIAFSIMEIEVRDFQPKREF